ncbi:retinol dehydrogenase 16-like isoform X2 [Rattus norvegicus]|uniref:retinol dehydrogenase 16-like isoform X2 n=1 Tax=Rattus norvegicus TaxID=10116 RepID=UPI002FD85D83
MLLRTTALTRTLGLVTNAGISIPTGPNEWLNKQDIASVLDVNLLGVIEVTLSMVPSVRKARGRVVNIASVMDRVSSFGGGYCISKYGVEAFSDSLSHVAVPAGTGGPVEPPALVQGEEDGLWGLVNNAGISGHLGPNEWMNKQNIASVLDVNLLGVIEVTLSTVPLVRKARGRVVNVASIAGRLSFCGGGYCISKYGVEAFSDSLRRELSYFGVKVAIVEPGFFRTDVTNGVTLSSNFQMLWDQTSSEVREVYGENYLASYLKMLNGLDQRCNKDLSLVTDCMEHALTSCHPRTRYSAGWDAKFFYLPMSYLPTFLVDALFYWTSPKPEKAL